MKVFKLVLSLCFLLIMASCLKEDNETLVLPKVKYAKPIEEVVPVTIQEQLKKYMPINSGSTPPDIDGAYLVNPDVLVYTSDGQYYVGYVFGDITIRFSGQNSVTNVITWEEKQGSSSATSDEVSISGFSDNFTAYFNTKGKRDDNVTTYKTATLVSGTVTSSGIKNLTYAFVMLEKNDPNKILMAVGAYRICKDGNGLASNTTWTSVKSAMIKGLGESFLQSETSNQINP